MATLSSLMAAPTAPTLKAALLVGLAAKGFPVTDWIEGGVERTRIEVESEVLADAYKLIPQIAAAGFLEEEDCSGPWLDLYAKGRYGLERTPGVFTVDTLRLTCAVGSGPVALVPGQLWATDSTGLLFNTTEGGTLADGGTLDLKIKAESPGADYNLARGAINRLVTALPGVTVTNIVGGLTTTGADEESDAKLKQRCRTRWATLGGGAPAAAYENWALSSSEAITRVKVIDTQPRGQGTVDVVIAGDTALGGDALAAAIAYINAKKPITDDVEVVLATAHAVAVAGTGKVRAGYKGAAETAIAQALADYAKAHPIGGKLYRAQLVELGMLPDGMVDLQLTTPAGAEEVLTDTEFLTLTVDFTAGLVLTEV